MQLYKGTVKSTVDFTQTGKFLVQCELMHAELVQVTYTTPAYSFNGGGILSIPEIGSKILFFELDNEFFYMSTIVDTPENQQKGGDINATVLGDKEIYKSLGKPNRTLFTNAVNAGLRITRHLFGRFLDSKVDVQSEKGKRLSLNDSSDINAVILRNEHGDGVTISAKESTTFPSRSIEVKSVGPQKYVVYQSDIEFLVVDGRDITIENDSTGAYANVGADTRGKFGNINLRSSKADINITAKGNDGRIFLTTPKARIQIETDGSISISSEKSINILAKENIFLEADQMISLNAAQINIKADANIVSEAGGNISAKSGGTNSLDGSQVHFNSGLSQSVSIPNINITEKTDYGD